MAGPKRVGGRVKLEGVDKLIHQLDALWESIVEELEPSVREGAEPIKDTAKVLVRKRTGNLRENIDMETVTRKPSRVVVAVGVKKEGWYALPLELGHVLKRKGKVVGSVPAKPFLRPAFNRRRRNARKVIAARLKEALLRVVKS